MEDKYLEKCPECESTAISFGEWESEGREAWQHVRCTNCGHRWAEVYEFARTEIWGGE
jgi:ribosomal protein S27E